MTARTPPILDSRPAAALAGRGTFQCPVCKAQSRYRLMQIRKAVRIVGLPVYNFGRTDHYVECEKCLGTFIPEVLRPEAASWKLKPQYLEVAMRVMVQMMLADGVIEEAEMQTISRVYAHYGGGWLQASRINTQVANVRADQRDIRQYLLDMAPRLNEPGREIVWRCAYEVAAADGAFQDEERELMKVVMAALDLDPRMLETGPGAPPA